MKKDLSKKSEKELLQIVVDGKRKLQDRALNLSGTATKDSFTTRKIRKNIARALTFLNSSSSDYSAKATKSEKATKNK